MHMNRVHGHVKRFCDLCPRSYSQKHFLVDHMNRVHLKRRPFECNICRHSSSTQSDLRMHLLSHKPKTECQICHKSFKFMKDHLRTHVRAKCTVCDGIVAKKNLDQHMKLHTKSKWRKVCKNQASIEKNFIWNIFRKNQRFVKMN